MPDDQSVGPESFRGEEALRFFTEPKNVCVEEKIIFEARQVERILKTLDSF